MQRMKMSDLRAKLAVVGRAGLGLAFLLLAGCSEHRKADHVEPPSIPYHPVAYEPAPTILERGSNELKPGDFIWEPDASPSGPVVLVVSIPEQLAHVYRNGIAIGVSTVSTGRKGHATPTGVFTILEKEKRHFSRTYNNAPMPFMERLTWDGIALHAGKLPGYPASHGCVRLPKEFSRLLYEVTDKGVTVVITDEKHDAQSLVHPGLLAPISPDGKSVQQLELFESGEYVWEPEKAADGPVSVLISSADQLLYAYRNGVEIARAKVHVDNPQRPLGHVVYTMLEGLANVDSPLAPGHRAHRWIRVHVKDEGEEASISTVAARVTIPKALAESLYAALVPGSTLQVTDLPITGETRTEPGFIVLAEHDGEIGG